MDLRTAVAASMLPASRARVAAAFRDLQHESAQRRPVSRAALVRLWPGYDAAIGHRLRRCSTKPHARWRTGRKMGIDARTIPDPRVSGAAGLHPRSAAGSLDRGNPDILSPADRGGDRFPGRVAVRPSGRSRIAAELAARRVVVASGLARGVDSAAHRGCLGAGGTTAAV